MRKQRQLAESREEERGECPRMSSFPVSQETQQFSLPLAPEGFPVSFQWPLHFEPVQNDSCFMKWRVVKAKKEKIGCTEDQQR